MAEKKRAPMSFNEDEVSVLVSIGDAVRRGGDARIMIRSKIAASAYSKLYRAQVRLNAAPAELHEVFRRDDESKTVGEASDGAGGDDPSAA